jgi:serine/threonine-protein kinase RsbW
MEKKFRKEMTSLDDVFDFLNRSMAVYKIDPSAAYSVSLAVEEFFTNMVKYSAAGNDDILIRISMDSNCLTVNLIENDVEPFDVTKTGEVDTARPLHERKPGGLGIHLAKHMVDSVSYEYVNRHSTITFTKNLEK